jgi:hypothetical protein
VYVIVLKRGRKCNSTSGMCGLVFGSSKKLGPTTVPDMHFDEIPRAQSPFRLGQGSH